MAFGKAPVTKKLLIVAPSATTHARRSNLTALDVRHAR